MRFSLKRWPVASAGALVFILVIWGLMTCLEGQEPVIKLKTESYSIGKQQEMKLVVQDKKSGISGISILVIQDGKTMVVHEKRLQGNRLLANGKESELNLDFKIVPKEIGLKDGKALLRIIASDFSWRGFFRGNQAYLDSEILIDTIPPSISVVSRAHNITRGGSGLLIYRLSEPCASSGVLVGDDFFPGYSGLFKDKSVHAAFFALGYDRGPKTPMSVVAVDYAGNKGRAGFAHYVRNRNFRKDRINISDSFLQSKLPEFEMIRPEYSKMAPKDAFIKINRELRRENYLFFVEKTKRSEPALLWKKAFKRLPGSARRAGFADHRTYYYKKKVIDKQVHLGIDLASLAHSPVPAANSGKVAFVGYVGIYGNTVMIDHGMGLFSMYAHLSSTGVKVGQVVSRGEIIGRTGKTGLAGGDHLHFAIMISGRFVDPVEWWDGKWIQNNIKGKIDEAAMIFSGQS